MPGTHLLPPNLLKLFAPRPPLPYIRPVGKDPDRIRKKTVSGVAGLLMRLKEESTQDMIDAGNQEVPEGMEEGEEPVFTLAEETRRQIRREERKKAREEKFKNAKESCTYQGFVPTHYQYILTYLSLKQTSHRRIPKPLVIHIKHCLLLVLCVFSL